MISSLYVQNFRQFHDLKIEGLRRLNLLVGENNVGKSAVLEALWLFVNDGDKEVLLDILALRGESIRSGLHLEAPKDLARSPFTTFTPWPPNKRDKVFDVYISTIKDSRSRLPFVTIDFDKYATGQVSIIRQIDLSEIFGEPHWMPHSDLIEHDTISHSRYFQSKRGDNVYVPVAGLHSRSIQEFWDRITLTEHEDDIDQALQLLEPTVQRISMLSTGPVVKLKGAPAPVPLRRLGEGMNRLFALALAMVNAKGGVLLIDEIETGLHRTTLDRMWPFLFTLAQRFDVEVFATTHSWDCISSFASAAKATPEDDGALIRLERRGESIVAVGYDEKTLAVATEQGIEVR